MTQLQVPAKPVDPMQQFYAKFAERARNDFAELMPPEALQVMVKRVIEEEFFQPRVVPDPQGYRAATTKPSLFAEIVREVAEPIMREAATQAVLERADDLRELTRVYMEKHRLEALLALECSQLIRESLVEMREAFKLEMYNLRETMKLR